MVWARRNLIHSEEAASTWRAFEAELRVPPAAVVARQARALPAGAPAGAPADAPVTSGQQAASTDAYLTARSRR